MKIIRKMSFLINFNSIKVRLELTAGAGLLGSLLFQFHKGAIRTIPSIRDCEIRIYFNSIKVRLERSWLPAAGAYALFQFHKGAIRTALPCCWLLVYRISIP